MNFKNPFSAVKTNTGNVEKDLLLKKMKIQSWLITKSIMKGQLTNKMVGDLDKIYKEYYKKFPNIQSEITDNKKIAKLKMLCKG
jgi:hypothetical protein